MGKERDTMNGLVIILIGIVVLAAAYIFYGRWLARKWGIDPKAKTPAYTKEDGVDYVPSSKFTVFSHQFSSIAGAGPVTGPILASVFGWVPVLLWLLVGGIFFGAVQDFGSLYASVKNEGKSIGMIVEKYIGKIGRKLFMIFCWLFTLLVIAAFTDMVAGTFNAKGLGDGVADEQLFANASAGSISMMFIGVAIILGVIIYRRQVKRMDESDNCHRTSYRYVCSWHESADICDKTDMGIYRNGISFLCINIAYVADDAAKGLSDYFYAARHDRRRGNRCVSGSSVNES